MNFFPVQPPFIQGGHKLSALKFGLFLGVHDNRGALLEANLVQLPLNKKIGSGRIDVSSNLELFSAEDGRDRICDGDENIARFYYFIGSACRNACNLEALLHFGAET